MLESRFVRADFNNDLEFDVYGSRNFQSPMTAGVSLFVYRVFHNGTSRTPIGRRNPDGTLRKPRLPVDMHFMLTAWAPTASLQHAIIGWMMRTLEDHPVLPGSLLSSLEPATFAPEELVEVAPVDLSTEDMMRIWESLVANNYQLSVAYAARTMLIDSYQSEGERPEVAERVLELHDLPRAGRVP